MEYVWNDLPAYDLGSNQAAGSAVYDAVSGSGSFLNNLVGTWGQVEVAKVKSNNSGYIALPNGQLYKEGQLVGGSPVSAGGLSPLLLLLIVGGIVFALKD